MDNKNSISQIPTLINCNGKLVDVSKPLVMGILNITPDSFFDGGKYFSKEKISKKIDEMISDGADIVDLGAVSTRPGANLLNFDEEISRLDFALEYLCKNYSETIISIDTFRSEIVKTVFKNYKIDIVNDISGGTLDEKMFDTVANLKLPYILMHIQGNPQNMQQNPQYENVTTEIIQYFVEKIDNLKKRGVNDIIIDPGFGFGKTIEHNFEILKNLETLKIIERPILVGLSRKSMIYKSLEISPDESLHGTIALNTIALKNGANILRVHDVKEAKQLVNLMSRLQN